MGQSNLKQLFFKLKKVVTGATDGIGKAYAEYFADKKFNVMLISRNQEKLNQVASGIGKKFKFLNGNQIRIHT